MIVCYQYRIFDAVDNKYDIIFFGRNMNDVFDKYSMGTDTICIAICGWKIKNNK